MQMLSILRTLFIIIIHLNGITSNDPPLFANVEDTNLYVKNNTFFIIPCTSSNKKFIDYSWYKDGKHLSDSNHQSLKFNPFLLENEGYYSCSLGNVAGKVKSRQHLFSLGYFIKPEFKSLRNHVNVDYGRAVTFIHKRFNNSDVNIDYQDGNVFITLSTDSNPVGSVTWIMENIRVSASKFVHKSSLENRLTILNFEGQTSIKGNFINGFEDNSEGYYSPLFILKPKRLSDETFFLTLVTKPKDLILRLYPGSTSVATFECVFNAKPFDSLTIEWFIQDADGQSLGPPISNGENYQISDYDRTLRIVNIGLERDGDYYKYPKPKKITCQGSVSVNSIQPIRESALLNFTSPPMIQTNLADESFRVEKPGTFKVVKSVGERVELPCHSLIRNTKTSLTWFINSEKFIPSLYNQHVQLSPIGSLIIEHLQVYDEAIYQCSLMNRNEHEEDLITFWVKVKDFKPVLKRVYLDYFPDGKLLRTFYLSVNSPVIINCPLAGHPDAIDSWFTSNGKHRISLEEKKNAYGMRKIVPNSDTLLGYPDGYFLFGTAVKRMEHSINSEMILINNLSKTMSGLSVFCSKSNRFGYTDVEMKLVVLQPPKITINQDSRTLYIVENRGLRLASSFTFDPDDVIEILWSSFSPSGKETIFDDDNDIRVVTNAKEKTSEIHIANVTSEIVGDIFACTVKSKLGNFTDSLRVKVISKCPTPKVIGVKNYTISRDILFQGQFTINWQLQEPDFMTTNQFNLYYSSLDNQMNSWKLIDKLDYRQLNCTKVDSTIYCAGLVKLTREYAQDSFLLSIDCENYSGRSEKTSPLRVVREMEETFTSSSQKHKSRHESLNNEKTVLVADLKPKIVGNLTLITAVSISFAFKNQAASLPVKFYHIMLKSHEDKSFEPYYERLTMDDTNEGLIKHTINNLKPSILYELEIIPDNGSLFEVYEKEKFVKIFRTLKDDFPQITNYKLVRMQDDEFHISWNLSMRPENKIREYHLNVKYMRYLGSSISVDHDSKHSLVRERSIVFLPHEIRTNSILFQPHIGDATSLDNQEFMFNVSLQILTDHGWTNTKAALWRPSWINSFDDKNFILENGISIEKFETEKLLVKVALSCDNCERYFGLQIANQFIWKSDQERNTLLRRLPVIFHLKCMTNVIVDSKHMDSDLVINHFTIDKSELTIDAVSKKITLTVTYQVVVTHDLDGDYFELYASLNVNKSLTNAIPVPMLKKRKVDENYQIISLTDKVVKLVYPIPNHQSYIPRPRENIIIRSVLNDSLVNNITSAQLSMVNTVVVNDPPVYFESLANSREDIPHVPILINYKMSVLALKSAWNYHRDSLTLSLRWNNTNDFHKVIKIYSVDNLQISLSYKKGNIQLTQQHVMPMNENYGDITLKLGGDIFDYLKTHLCHNKIDQIDATDEPDSNWQIQFRMMNNFTTSQPSNAYPIESRSLFPSSANRMSFRVMSSSDKENMTEVNLHFLNAGQKELFFRIFRLDSISQIKLDEINGGVQVKRGKGKIILPSNSLYQFELQSDAGSQFCAEEEKFKISTTLKPDSHVKSVIESLRPRPVEMLFTRPMDASSECHLNTSITLSGDFFHLDEKDKVSFELFDIVNRLSHFEVIYSEADSKNQWLEYPVRFPFSHINKFSIIGLKSNTNYIFKVAYSTQNDVRTQFSQESKRMRSAKTKPCASSNGFQVKLLYEKETMNDYVEMSWPIQREIIGNEYSIMVENICRLSNAHAPLYRGCNENLDYSKDMYTYHVSVTKEDINKTSSLKFIHLKSFQYYLIRMQLTNEIGSSQSQYRVIFSGNTNSSREIYLQNKFSPWRSLSNVAFGQIRNVHNVFNSFKCNSERYQDDVSIHCNWHLEKNLITDRLIGLNFTIVEKNNAGLPLMLSLRRNSSEIFVQNVPTNKILRAFTTYDIILSQITINENHFNPEIVRVNTPEMSPDPPANLAMKWIGRNEIVVEWEPSDESNGILRNYMIELYKDAQLVENVIVGKTKLFHVLKNFHKNSLYRVQICARTSFERWGPKKELSFISYDNSYNKSQLVQRLGRVKNIHVFSSLSNYQMNIPASPALKNGKPKDLNVNDFVLMMSPKFVQEKNQTNRDHFIIQWSTGSMNKFESVHGYLIEFRTSKRIDEWKTLRAVYSNETMVQFDLTSQDPTSIYHILNEYLDENYEESESDREILEQFRVLSKLPFSFDNTFNIIPVQFRVSPFGRNSMGEPSSPSHWLFFIFQRIDESLVQKWWFLLTIILVMITILIALLITFCVVIKSRTFQKYRTSSSIEKKISQQIFTNNFNAFDQSMASKTLQSSMNYWLSSSDKGSGHFDPMLIPGHDGMMNMNENSYLDLLKMPSSGQSGRPIIETCLSPSSSIGTHGFENQCHSPCCNSPSLIPGHQTLSYNRMKNNLRLQSNPMGSLLRSKPLWNKDVSPYNLNDNLQISSVFMSGKPSSNYLDGNNQAESIASSSNSSTCTPTKIDPYRDRYFETLKNQLNNFDCCYSPSVKPNSNSFLTFNSNDLSQNMASSVRVEKSLNMSSRKHQLPYYNNAQQQSLAFLPQPDFNSALMDEHSDDSLSKVRGLLNNTLNLESTLL